MRRAAAVSTALLLLHPIAAGAAGLPEESWTVARGVVYREATVVEPQGSTRVHVLTADLRTSGLQIDQVSGADDRTRTPTSRLVQADRAVAGVNGDFFDISDTGAAQGVAVDRQRGLLHAPRSGWNTALVVRPDRSAAVEQLRFTGTVTRRAHRALVLGGYNTPHVGLDQVNLYDHTWGPQPGRDVLDGATHVRQVVIDKGVVRSNRATISRAKTYGSILVGRGRGADAMRSFRVGSHVALHKTLDDSRVSAAVGGSEQILRSGRVVTPASSETNPHTMAATSPDGRTLWLVTVDGRSESSGGMTLTQLATFARSLGAADAVNLDGGGSSTMVGPDAAGAFGVRNAPSDAGVERAVANGLVLQEP